MSINLAKRNCVSDWPRILLRAGARAIWLTLSLLCVAALSPAQPTIQIKEYVVGFPFDITVGPDGAMWFTNYTNIGRITASGAITTYPLPNNSIPTKIAAGPDGALWFTESPPSAIGRMTTDGIVTEFPLPNPSGEVWGITAGPDGALWFSEWVGGNIGRITATGVITEYPLPRSASTPWITVGPDGALWFTEANESGGGGYIGRITTSGIITEYLLPPPVPGLGQWGFNGIVTGPDGALWVTDGDYRILRVTTHGDATEFSLPGCPPCVAGTGAIQVGPDGALWFTLFGSNSIGRITTNGAITQYPIPTPNSQPTGMATGPDGSIWFVEHAAGKIGQLVLEKTDTTPPIVTVRPDTRILWPPNQMMITVTVSGTVTDIGSGVLASSVEYAVTDEYQLIQPRGHITLDPAGNYSFTLSLRASREGTDKNGRHYWIRVSARDNAGNRGVKWSVVDVPHDRR